MSWSRWSSRELGVLPGPDRVLIWTLSAAICLVRLLIEVMLWPICWFTPLAASCNCCAELWKVCASPCAWLIRFCREGMSDGLAATCATPLAKNWLIAVLRPESAPASRLTMGCNCVLSVLAPLAVAVVLQTCDCR
ncbi:hypothetical protein GALL_431980 [mine drainage metagenome]|uniref:Uncharacterized protein n=1 Tax=mine drainage metagenome TaxID=410659 RepID=A0A1J5Q571_9ZZZZ